jgi:type I restriction enzyme M protein
MGKNNSTKSEKFEVQLFKAADKLRKNIDAAEYKHIVLGLIFLKYISDSFEELHSKLKEGKGKFEGAVPEDQDEYKAENVFWVPKNARWTYLHSRAKLPTIGKDLDDAMELIEKENPTLKGILPKVFAKPNLDKAALGGLIDLIGNIALGDEAAKSKDILGKVYEYFLGEFALAEGKKGGQFYTPKSIVKVLVEMIEPYKGRVYDPCCGSGGMFVMSEKFVQEHQGRLDDISIYGQESNQTTYRLARMNLAIRGIDGSQVKWNNEGSFLKNAHPDLKADFILANPPFNDSDWSGELLQNDGRWKYGTPPASNANFAWMQHFIYHLAPNGMAGFVLANSSLSAERTGEVSIRSKIIESDLVECILILPNNLFFNTSIPACLWFINRNKGETTSHRNRQKEILFIDGRAFGHMIDKAHRVFTDEDITNLSNIYHSWKSKNGQYQDTPQLCKSVSLDSVKEHSYNLSPNLYIDIEKSNGTKDKTNQKISEFIISASSDKDERKKLEVDIQSAFKTIGYTELSELNFTNINHKRLINLENSLFEKWFVNFELPPKVAIDNFYQTDNYDIASLPAEWELKTLTQVANVIDCLHSKKPEKLSESYFTLLEVNNIASSGLLDMSDRYFISEEDYKKWTRNIEVSEGDCVITNTGRVGAVAQIPKGAKFAIGRNMTAVRVNKELILPTYLLDYLMSQYMKSETYRKTDIGTILDSLNVKGIKKILVVVPPIEIQKIYESFARPIRRLIEIGGETKT